EEDHRDQQEGGRRDAAAARRPANGPHRAGHARLRLISERPRGLARTARKTRCPARIEYCGSMLAPIVWATPSTMPPVSVPHSEPSPPMTTASNAKMSWVGPDAG